MKLVAQLNSRFEASGLTCATEIMHSHGTARAYRVCSQEGMSDVIRCLWDCRATIIGTQDAAIKYGRI